MDKKAHKQAVFLLILLILSWVIVAVVVNVLRSFAPNLLMDLKSIAIIILLIAAYFIPLSLRTYHYASLAKLNNLLWFLRVVILLLISAFFVLSIWVIALLI